MTETGSIRLDAPDESRYTSTQAASSSPGRRKGTFGTPIGIKKLLKNIDLQVGDVEAKPKKSFHHIITRLIKTTWIK